MKITVWTLATEGDNSELSVSVHPTEQAAYDTLRDYLADEIAERLAEDADPDDDEAATFPDDELSDLWADRREGVATIDRHEIEIPAV